METVSDVSISPVVDREAYLPGNMNPEEGDTLTLAITGGAPLFPMLTIHEFPFPSG